MLHLYGLVEGRRHDIKMYRESGLYDHLSTILLKDGEQYYIYGDLAHPLRAYLQSGFHRGNVNDATQQFNAAMSAVRISVEWAFKDVKKYFAH